MQNGCISKWLFKAQFHAKKHDSNKAANNSKAKAKAKSTAKGKGSVTLRIRMVKSCADKLRIECRKVGTSNLSGASCQAGCARLITNIRRGSTLLLLLFYYFCFFLSLDICQAKQIEFAALASQRCLACNRIEIKIRNTPESAVIIAIDVPCQKHDA